MSNNDVESSSLLEAGDSASKSNEVAKSKKLPTWAKAASLLMFMWVSISLLRESVSFDIDFSLARLGDNDEAGSGDTLPSSSIENDMDDDSEVEKKFSNILDVIESEMETKAEEEGTDNKEVVADREATIHDARKGSREFSTLPRTSEVRYNYMEPGKKYFLYSPSGGFSNQLICFVNALMLAKRYNRILVVPGKGRHSNLYKGYLRLKQNEIVPMDHALDFKHIEEATGVKLLPLNVTVESFIRTVPNRDIKIMGLPSEGLMHPKDGSIFNKVKSAGGRTPRQLFWLKGRFFTSRWLNKNYWVNSRFSPYLQDLAATVGTDLLGGQFNSMHIRLGDYASRSKKRNADASKYLKEALGMGFKKEIPLYVASEEGRSSPYFKPLIEYFDNVYFQEDLLTVPSTRKWLVDFTLRTPTSAIRNDLFGLAEMLICARADLYLGTRISTFSKTIGSLRRTLSASIPTLYAELKELEKSKARRRASGLHSWSGPPSVKEDTLQ